MYKQQRSFHGPKRNAPTRSRQQRSNNSRGRSNINPAKFVNKSIVTAQNTVAYEPKHLFTDFGLAPIVEANLALAGFTAPSAIQDQTIPLALSGRDVIGLANTGTGKTAAFLVPILNAFAERRTTQSVLIMAPTRELAQQIDAEFKKFSREMKIYSCLCVGGVGIGPQLATLRRDPHVIIGTPGRLKDHMNRGTIRLNAIKTLVLDEADRMLDMGFINDIRDIASRLPADRQTLCFSATLSEGVKRLVYDFMKNPELVSVKVSETNDHIYQDVVRFNGNDHKRELLIEMLQKEDFDKVIVFGETKFGVQRLADNLQQLGISSSAIHGNKSQSQRMRALEAFKANRSKVLVATDVAARGLDIPNVSHVINYDLPQTYDDYVHRIGRTGRSGKSGVALTFVSH